MEKIDKSLQTTSPSANKMAFQQGKSDLTLDFAWLLSLDFLCLLPSLKN